MYIHTHNVTKSFYNMLYYGVPNGQNSLILSHMLTKPSPKSVICSQTLIIRALRSIIWSHILLLFISILELFLFRLCSLFSPIPPLRILISLLLALL